MIFTTIVFEECGGLVLELLSTFKEVKHLLNGLLFTSEWERQIYSLGDLEKQLFLEEPFIKW